MWVWGGGVEGQACLMEGDLRGLSRGGVGCRWLERRGCLVCVLRGQRREEQWREQRQRGLQVGGGRGVGGLLVACVSEARQRGLQVV